MPDTLRASTARHARMQEPLGKLIEHCPSASKNWKPQTELGCRQKSDFDSWISVDARDETWHCKVGITNSTNTPIGLEGPGWVQRGHRKSSRLGCWGLHIGRGIGLRTGLDLFFLFRTRIGTFTDCRRWLKGVLCMRHARCLTHFYREDSIPSQYVKSATEELTVQF